MKTLKTSAVITSISSRQDRSARFSTETPEYSDEEFTEFRKLQGKNVMMTIEPMDETPEEEIKVDKAVNEMTMSQELRWKILKRWDNNEALQKNYPDKSDYYKHVMRKIISQLEVV
jgi:hypothetical protein